MLQLHAGLKRSLMEHDVILFAWLERIYVVHHGNALLSTPSRMNLLKPILS